MEDKVRIWRKVVHSKNLEAVAFSIRTKNGRLNSFDFRRSAFQNAVVATKPILHFIGHGEED